MKSLKIILVGVIFLLISLFLIVKPTLAQPIGSVAEPVQEQLSFELILGGSYTLAENESMNKGLVVIGGVVELSPGSVLTGDIYMVGGSIEVSGTIDGDVSCLGGQVNLTNTGIIVGNVNLTGSSFIQAAGSQISGRVNEGQFGSLPVMIPQNVRLPMWEGAPFRFFRIEFNPLLDSLSLLLQSFVWAVAAVIVALAFPHALERTGQTVISQPLVSAGFGCLTVVVLPLLIVLLAITLICIPVSLVGLILLVVAWVYGLLALGTEIGKRLTMLFRQEWALAVSAGIGTFLLTLLVNGIGRFITCFGWGFALLIGMFGLGAALLTRFGRRNYPLLSESQSFEENLPERNK